MFPELVKNKCIPYLLYLLECYILPKSALRSLKICCYMFLNETIQNCHVTKLFMTVALMSSFLPSELLKKRMVRVKVVWLRGMTFKSC